MNGLRRIARVRHRVFFFFNNVVIHCTVVGFVLVDLIHPWAFESRNLSRWCDGGVWDRLCDGGVWERLCTRRILGRYLCVKRTRVVAVFEIIVVVVVFESLVVVW